MRDRAPSFPARRNSGIPHPASDPAQLYASLSANTRPWAKRDVTQFRMVSHEIEKCARWLGHACGVARDEPAAHGRASRRFAVLCISRGMRAGSAQDAGCVRDISNAGCMRAGCWPMPVQTGGQSWPRANRRLSKWVAKRLSKPWTGGGRWRRRDPWSFLHSSQLDRYFAPSWTGDAGWRRDWVHKRCGIGGGIERDRCGIAVNPAFRSRTGITPSRLHANGALRS